ncbi:MAG: hypothetical protein RL685_3056 [Pseudomonadota bacterium]|jgi:hypothetical protein
MTTATFKRAEGLSKGRLWAWVPGLLLTALLGTQLTVLHSVLDDPSFALEPDYYRKAVAWDSQRVLARESQALGWHPTLHAQPGIHATDLQLEVQLRDAKGDPLAGALLHVRAFANARAARVFETSLVETTPGIYTGKVPSSVLGLWELRLEATRGTDRFATVLRASVSPRQVLP